MEHIKMHQNESATAYACDHCKKIFNDVDECRRHVSTCSIALTFTCQECFRDFVDSAMLNRHENSCLHEPHCFPCKECDSFWNSAHSLKLHYAETHQRASVCGLCGHVTNDDKENDQHWMQWHQGADVFKCEFCGDDKLTA